MYFAVKTTDDSAISFNFEEYLYQGSKYKPNTLTYGVETTGALDDDNGISSLWYSYTADTDKKITVAVDATTNTIAEVYTDSYVSLASTEDSEKGGKAVVSLTAGSTYYIKVTKSGDGSEVKFTVKDYTANTDDGYSSENVRTLTEATTQITEAADTMYFKYVVSGDSEKSYRVSIGAIDGATINAYTSDDFYYSSISSDRIFASGETVYLRVSGVTATSYSLALTTSEVEAKAHQITVKSNGSNYSGTPLTVAAYKYTNYRGFVLGDKVAEGTTVDGVATLTMIPGSYVLLLSGLDEENYVYTQDMYVYTDVPSDGSKDNGANYDVNVIQMQTYTFNVTGAGSSATVALYKQASEGSFYSTASYTIDIDSNGVASQKIIPGIYKVVVSGLVQYQQTETLVTTADTTTYTVTTTELEKKPVAVTTADGEASALSFTNGYTYFNVTAAEAGNYKITITLDTTDYPAIAYTDWTLSVNGVAYSFENDYTNSRNLTVVLPASEVFIEVKTSASSLSFAGTVKVVAEASSESGSGTGSGTSSSEAALTAGNYDFKTYEVVNYGTTSYDAKFTASAAGSYTITADSAFVVWIGSSSVAPKKNMAGQYIAEITVSAGDIVEIICEESDLAYDSTFEIEEA
jgi:hypothetical protein